MTRSTLVVGSLMALAAQILVGSSFAALGVIRHYPLALGQAARYAAAVAIMILIARRFAPRPTPGDLVRLGLVAFSGLVAFNLLSLEGVVASDAASVGVVVGCVPIVLAFLGPLQRGERPRMSLLAAGAVVAAGAALVQAGGANPTLTGFVLALGALACEAAFTLLAVPALPRLGALGVSVWTCALGTAMFVLWALADGVWRAPTHAEAASLGWLTAAVTVAAFLMWYGAVGRIGAERAGLFCGMVPVSAAATAALVGTITITPMRVAGALAVGVGVTAGMLLGRTRNTPPPPLAGVAPAGEAPPDGPSAG